MRRSDALVGLKRVGTHAPQYIYDAFFSNGAFNVLAPYPYK